MQLLARSRAEVLTLGAAAALLLPVVCSPDTRAGSNKCSLRLVLRDRGDGVPPGGFYSACQSCPQPGQTAAALGMERGEALVIVGCGEVWAVVKIGRGWISATSDKTRQKAAKIHKVSGTPRKQCVSSA